MTDPIFGTEMASILADIPQRVEALALTRLLRRQLPPELARRAAQLHSLRLRSLSRFESTFLPYPNKKGLEQATPQKVAEARAEHIGERSAGALCWDATCGIGADSVALYRAGIDVVSSDFAPKNCEHARANIYSQPARSSELGPTRRFVLCADATRQGVKADLILLDPDRRVGGRKSLNPAAWSPSFESALATVARARGACLKLAPGLDLGLVAEAPASLLPPTYGTSWQWTSWRSSLCELTLWTGELAFDGDHGVLRHAQVIDRGGQKHLFSGLPSECPALDPRELPTLRYLAEPDPAIIRSGLVGTLARKLGLAPIAPRSAYLGGAERPAAGLVASWRVLGYTALDRKRVRAMLGEFDIGPLTVKKRGHPDSADVLAAKYRGAGRKRGLLAVARLEKGHVAFLLEAEQSARMVGDEGFEPPTSSV